MSEATGLPLATVVDLDRRLVKGGLRTKGGRGLNVAPATALDAARLLTAILASPLATNAVDAVQRYARAIVDPERSCPSLFAETGIDDLTALPKQHGFVEALTALVTAAASQTLADPLPRIEVFTFTRAIYARIRLSHLPGGKAAHVEYLPPATRRPSAAQRDSAGDLEQSRRITERTILAMGRLLAGGGEHDQA